MIGGHSWRLHPIRDSLINCSDSVHITAVEEDEDTIIVEGTAMTTEVGSTVEDQEAVVGGRSKDAATVIFAG